MKKTFIFIFSMLALMFTLTSCSSKELLTKRTDNPNTTLAASLKLDSVKNGVVLNAYDNTQDDYYVIKIAEDANSTLIAYDSMLDSTLELTEGRTESLVVSPLTFNKEISDTEKVNIITEVFEENKLASKITVSFEIKTTTTWATKLVAGVEELQNAYLEGQRDNALSIVYLPVFVEHYQDGKNVLEVYVLIPLYYEITTVSEGKSSSEVFNSFAKPELLFNEVTEEDPTNNLYLKSN